MDLIFFILWFIFPYIWFQMLKFSSIQLFEVSIPSILIWFIFAFSYFGFPFLWFGLDSYRNYDVQDKDIILSMFLHTVFSISFLIIGFFIGKVLLGSLQIRETYQKKLSYFKSEHRITYLFYFLLFLICCFMLFSYINVVGFENLAFLVAIGYLSEGNITELRSSSTNAFDNYHWYKLFMIDLMLAVTLFFFSLSLCQKNYFRNIVMAFSIIVCSFALLMSGEKGQIIEIILGLFLVHSLTRNSGKFSIKNMIIFSFIGALTVFPIYYFLMESGSSYEALTGALSRITTGQLQPMYVYFEYIPDYRDFLMGKTFPNPGLIFPYEPVTITQEAMAWFNSNEASLGIVGSLPAMFWVEAYVNFGSFSILIVSFLLGFFLYSLNIFFTQFKPNPIVISLFVWLILFFKDLAISFFSDFFISIFLFCVVLITFFIYLFSNKGRIFIQR